MPKKNDPTDRPGAKFTEGDATFTTHACGERLWQYTTKPLRWPPGVFFKQKMSGAFQYAIVDEVHETKSDEAARAVAAARIMSSVPFTLALTGTLTGGKAHEVFPLLWRFGPKGMTDEGYEWGKEVPFAKRYGRIEVTKTTTITSGGAIVERLNAHSMRKDKEGAPKLRIVPGIMPSLFGRHLLDKTIFISLEDMAVGLPKHREFLTNKRDDSYDEEDHNFHVDCCIDMGPELGTEYERIESILDAENRKLIQFGSMKLLGATLATLLQYPDRPYNWVAPTDNPEDLAVGYRREDESWCGIVQPADLPESIVYPKEQALIDICKREVEAGNQVWVYCTMTHKRDIQPRLQRLLEEVGLRVAILRQHTVQPRQRLNWIADKGPKVDVIISHAELVKTGIDFFSKQAGGHNFNTIVFYETGYSLFTLRQASRRAWRIGQLKTCRTYYLHYAKTMQQRAIQLMARKMAAAMAIDGQLKMEGLSSMADDDSMAMALARSLSEAIDESEIGRNWEKIKSAAMPGTRQLVHKVKPPVLDPWLAAGLESLENIPLDELDMLDMESSLMAQTLLDNDTGLARATLAKMAAELFDDDLMLVDV